MLTKLLNTKLKNNDGIKIFKGEFVDVTEEEFEQLVNHFKFDCNPSNKNTIIIGTIIVRKIEQTNSSI